MSLKEKIDSDLKNALKARNEAVLRSLRSLKSALMVAETEPGAQNPLPPDKEISVLQRQVKQRKDSIEQFEKAGRNDLALIEKEELEIIQQYLPASLSQDELEREVRNIIRECGASGMKDFGKVMGTASSLLKGKAEGKIIAETVKKCLNE